MLLDRERDLLERDFFFEDEPLLLDLCSLAVSTSLGLLLLRLRDTLLWSSAAPPPPPEDQSLLSLAGGDMEKLRSLCLSLSSYFLES